MNKHLHGTNRKYIILLFFIRQPKPIMCCKHEVSEINTITAEFFKLFPTIFHFNINCVKVVT